MHDWDNQAIAEKLLEIADLLEQQNANPFRVGAYRRAARTVAAHPEPLSDLTEREGVEGLDQIPTIGRSIALAIQEMLRTGRWQQLERLRGTLDPEQVFQSIPGVGAELARRIHETLEIESLPELELAAHDGRLEQVPGVGPRRARMIAAALGQMLQRRPVRPHPAAEEPTVDVLLDVDREYRDKAARGELRKIAPRRFNPSHEAWLPILHTQRSDWHLNRRLGRAVLPHGSRARGTAHGRHGNERVAGGSPRSAGPGSRMRQTAKESGPGKKNFGALSLCPHLTVSNGSLIAPRPDRLPARL